ncbi:uncharacterized protein LOC134682112 [Mytilus trossulus]|uniref:uncharacterized protein LOC134682112 n=1 Tax=Mytilus trossulus TaxID=6551 RepID=UPI003007075D
MWRPNTEQEASYVFQEFIHPNENTLWTGANDRDGDGTYTFYKENGPFSKDLPPFGSADFGLNPGNVYVTIHYVIGQRLWFWYDWNKFDSSRYICEYQRRVCP